MGGNSRHLLCEHIEPHCSEHVHSTRTNSIACNYSAGFATVGPPPRLPPPPPHLCTLDTLASISLEVARKVQACWSTGGAGEGADTSAL